METVFRQAQVCDADTIVCLFTRAILRMREIGIDQWDEIYPDEALLRDDIARGEMFALSCGEEILCVAVINAEQDEEYAAGDWRCGGRAAVIHRLCVHPDFQGRGIAKEIIRHAEKLITEKGYDCIRLDVFTQNPAALKLYEGLGFCKTGEITYRKGVFALMEKAL